MARGIPGECLQCRSLFHHIYNISNITLVSGMTSYLTLLLTSKRLLVNCIKFSSRHNGKAIHQVMYASLDATSSLNQSSSPEVVFFFDFQVLSQNFDCFQLVQVKKKFFKAIQQKDYFYVHFIS